jgi:O-antigen/teichoic acid export membrane protein
VPDNMTPDLRSLDKSLSSGLAWTGGVRALAQVVSWVMTIGVMRLLSPADYGVFGLAMLFIQIGSMAAEFGLGSTLVYLRELDPRHIEQLHGFSLLLGVVAILVSLLLARPFSAFFHVAGLAPVIVVLATTFLVDSFRTVPAALLARDMRFKELAWLDLLSAVLVPSATMALAAAGFGYWALVIGNVVSAIVSTLAVLVWQPQRPSWPRPRELRSALSFGADVIVARLAWWGYSNADFAIAGRILGAGPLGVYNCAWTVACAPMEKVVSIFARVMPPLFSQVQRDHVLAKRYLLAITETIAVFTLPACLGLALVARDFVLVILGEKWASATTPLRFLCVYAAVQSLATLLPHILNAAGKTRLAMSLNLLMLCVLPLAFFVAGTRWGVTGIAGVWVFIYPALLAPAWWFTLRAVNASPRQYFRSLWPALSATLLMGAAVVGVSALTGAWPAPLRLAADVIAGAAAYGATLLVLHGGRLRYWRSLFAAAESAEPEPDDVADASLIKL